MPKFILRLDDACETMDEKKWQIVENLLDKYKIKPIVGIIPDNKDKTFNYPLIKNYNEEYPLRWQKKGWIIAQHGCHHKFQENIKSEFTGLNYEEQKKIIDYGYSLLKEKGLNPICFFAPAHNFDINTIKACVESGNYKFISDGYALYPYKNHNILFLPCLFSKPRYILPFGIYTFVIHPNEIDEKQLFELEEFIIKYNKNFNVNIEKIINKFVNRKRNLPDLLIKFIITTLKNKKNNKKT